MKIIFYIVQNHIFQVEISQKFVPKKIKITEQDYLATSLLPMFKVHSHLVLGTFVFS